MIRDAQASGAERTAMQLRSSTRNQNNIGVTPLGATPTPTPTPAPTSVAASARTGVSPGVETLGVTPTPTPTSAPTGGAAAAASARTGVSPGVATLGVPDSPVFLVLSIAAISAVIFAGSIDVSGETATLLNQYKDALLVACLVTSLLTLSLFVMFDFDIRQKSAPFSAFIVLSVIFVISSVVLAIFARGSMFLSGLQVFSYTILLAASFIGVFIGSTIKTTTGSVVFYASILGIAIILGLFLISSGNVESMIPAPQPDILPGAQYLYKWIQSQENVAAKRTIYDQVYLSVAYPTLGDDDKQPIHNSSEFSGAHSLSNYVKNLNRGGAAFLLDIFYESNPSSPNVNTWRVGTLNTNNGVIQNRRTISLRSVLSKTADAINRNSTKGRTIFLFLNPRYKTDQQKIRENIETQLAKDIRETIPYINLPSIASGANAESLGEMTFDQARNQVILLLGGTDSDIASSPLKHTIHSRINLTNAFVESTGVGGDNSIAYSPGQSTTPIIPGSLLIAGVNRSGDLLAPYDKTSGNRHLLVGTLPLNRSGSPVYPINEIAPYIRYSASFPFIYTSAFINYQMNESFFNGFAPIVAPQYIRSMIFSSLDNKTLGARNPYIQIQDETKRCGDDKGKVLNPENDIEWGIIFEGSSPVLSNTRWCDNWNSSIKVSDTNIGRLVLYQQTPPPTQNGHSGIVPKPLLVDTGNGEKRPTGVFQIRKNLSITEVKSQTLNG
jgi:hypothetical protein